jgi:uncharacterized protein with GYD domain
MAFYLIEAKLSQDGVKALLATPHNRRESAAKLVEAIGGTLHQYFFAFGEYDIVLLVEAPDHASVTAGSLVALGRRGLSATRTTVLMTAEEASEAMKKAGEIADKFAQPSQ